MRGVARTVDRSSLRDFHSNRGACPATRVAGYRSLPPPGKNGIALLPGISVVPERLSQVFQQSARLPDSRLILSHASTCAGFARQNICTLKPIRQVRGRLCGYRIMFSLALLGGAGFFDSRLSTLDSRLSTLDSRLRKYSRCSIVPYSRPPGLTQFSQLVPLIFSKRAS
jgi:hypothetical protein